MSFTLQQLRHFVAFVEAGSVTLAAAACRISQPSMTASLKALEEATGAQLLARHQGRLGPTAEGERLYRHARGIVAAAAEAAADLRRPVRPVEGSVTLAVTDTVTGYLLPAWLGAVQRQLPLLTLQLVEEERPAIEGGLLQGRFDAALMLVSNLRRVEELSHEILIRSPRRLWTAADHPLAGRASLTLREVAEWDYVLLDMDEHVETVQRYWARYGLAPRTVFRSKSVEGVRNLVAHGMGVTILSDLVFRRWSHDSGRIRRIALVDDVPSMDVGLAHARERPPSPAVEALAEVFRRLARELPEPRPPEGVVP
ncbi:DNA-binding transcriptional regulator, LysR family [Roseomonas rosea]|uniref:DNA-binding transcriptional regulator, LysR family n=1 Tax=Muricoccus roseus TaxID=198092 RepID=A0A1M6DLS7_9PROT|nr:LysR family transcriptional regulator [Roseomonas rosea]SHI74130.1 DNA-binding transcriptional regulator, LysR family [Roseomonas rosea]